MKEEIFACSKKEIKKRIFLSGIFHDAAAIIDDEHTIVGCLVATAVL